MKGTLRISALAFLAAIGISALLPILWTSESYEVQFRAEPDAAPSLKFLLGTDALGRDRLARLLYGTRVSLALAPAAAFLACAVAGILGCAAGFAGGWIDRLLEGAADLFMSLPWFFVLLTLRACLPLNVSPGMSATITFVLLGLLGWPAPARVIRAAATKLRHSDFLLQARAGGTSSTRLVIRHLIPNVMPVLLAQFWIAIPVFILTEATLGMLGLGIAEPLPSWGGMLRELEGSDIHSQPWILAPAALLAMVVSCLHSISSKKDYAL